MVGSARQRFVSGETFLLIACFYRPDLKDQELIFNT